METVRIAELLDPFMETEPSAVLSANQLQSISTYIDLLIRWNTRVNLTAVRQPEDIVTRHFGESLFAARHLFPSPTQRTAVARVVDVGSGAGFPGLPIKIFAPQIRLTLIESNQKKATFLREVVRAITLTNVDVFFGRAEDFPVTPSPADVVTLRAVERFDSILPIAARLVAPSGGRLAILIGESQRERVGALIPEVRFAEPVKLPLSSKRVLIIGTKGPS